jgi:hypothetical protein
LSVGEKLDTVPHQFRRKRSANTIGSLSFHIISNISTIAMDSLSSQCQTPKECLGMGGWAIPTRVQMRALQFPNTLKHYIDIIIYHYIIHYI